MLSKLYKKGSDYAFASVELYIYDNSKLPTELLIKVNNHQQNGQN